MLVPHSCTPGPGLFWVTLPDSLAPTSDVCPSMASVRLSTPVAVGHMCCANSMDAAVLVGLLPLQS